MFSHIKLLRTRNNIHIYIYLHDSFLDIVLHHLQKNKRISKSKRFILRRVTRKFSMQTTKKIRIVARTLLKQIRTLILYYLKSKFINKF